MLNTQSTTTPERKIKFDRSTRDYALFLNGEFVGYAATYSEGEQRLDELLHDRLTHGN